MSKRKTYGPHKVRTMARSILPSSRRDTARKDKADIKRRARRTVRQKLHNEIFDLDSAYETEADFLTYPNHEIVETVWDRRNYDKTAHFVRWARVTASELDNPQDKYRMIEQIMPDTLPGRHALTHLPWDKHPQYEGTFFRAFDFEAYQARNKQRELEAQQRRIANYLNACDLLYRVCAAPNGLKNFNTAIKNSFVRGHERKIGVDYSSFDTSQKYVKRHPVFKELVCLECCETPRVLRGVHDIDAFICDASWKMHRETINVAMQWLSSQNI